ncbi:uncharacterized protein B0I36DRAFT_331201 [Microdochium trichocladiopsis]|uniref:Hypersensitive response-inducing protein n=1 Tax=Microdochium trichocladiopsis TaxID=1682393 RepID=A0A9P9BMY0_9PEZI|nr:uncharacterized protein B0I36DRAFT_331201 [Microdochium trichocladiopsis]KAH7026728.1 hypothetical protein B0I36DRAFT_331201 [Microdochium trichocladiopsis]
MKFFTLAFAATASAAAVKRCGGSAGSAPVFDVTEFTAGCTPHSVLCHYSFKVVRHNAGETTPVSCSATQPAFGSNQLPSVSEGTCENSSRTFKIVRSEGPAIALFVSQPVSPSTNITGVHQINPDELAYTNQQVPTGVVQTYIGSPNFPLNAPEV